MLSCLWDGAYKRSLLIEKRSSCSGSSGFPLSLSEWFFTICLMPYNCKLNVLSASLNKTFSSFQPNNTGPYNKTRSSQCSTTGVRKAVVCVILSVG